MKKASKAEQARDQPARLRVVVTNGHGIPIRSPGLRQWLARVAPARARGTITIALVSDRQMRALNRTYRHIDRATDVLSFPASAERDLSAPGSGLRAPGMQIRRKSSRSRQPVARSQEVGRHLGDLAISLDTARRQADEMRHSLQTELRVLALHGLLHLLGYDHERDRGEMARLERRLGRRRGLTHGLTERR